MVVSSPFIRRVLTARTIRSGTATRADGTASRTTTLRVPSRGRGEVLGLGSGSGDVSVRGRFCSILGGMKHPPGSVPSDGQGRSHMARVCVPDASSSLEAETHPVSTQLVAVVVSGWNRPRAPSTSSPWREPRLRHCMCLCSVLPGRVSPVFFPRTFSMIQYHPLMPKSWIGLGADILLGKNIAARVIYTSTTHCEVDGTTIFCQNLHPNP